MNKEQSADDPSVDSIRVKNMLNSTISMSYPDVVIATFVVLLSVSEAFRAIRGSVGEARYNNMEGLFLVVDRIASYNC